MRYFILIFFLILSFNSFGQNKLKGKIYYNDGVQFIYNYGFTDEDIVITATQNKIYRIKYNDIDSIVFENIIQDAINTLNSKKIKFSYKEKNRVNAVSNFEIENGDVVYKRTFDISNLNSDELKNKYLKFLETIPNVSVIKEDDSQINAEISDNYINYKVYGIKTMGAGMIAYPFFSKLIIQFKDGKYRLVVRNIYIDNKSVGILFSGMEANSHFKNFLLNKDASDFKKTQYNLKILDIYDRFFKDTFTYKEIVDKDDDW